MIELTAWQLFFTTICKYVLLGFQYNDLRSDMVLLYDMKSAITNCEQELQSLKAEYEALNPGDLGTRNSFEPLAIVYKN